MTEAKRGEWFDTVLIALAYILIIGAVLLSGCNYQSSYEYQRGEKVFHQLDGRLCLVQGGPYNLKYGTYYIVRYIDDEGDYRSMTVEEHEIGKKDYGDTILDVLMKEGRRIQLNKSALLVTDPTRLSPNCVLLIRTGNTITVVYAKQETAQEIISYLDSLPACDRKEAKHFIGGRPLKAMDYMDEIHPYVMKLQAEAHEVFGKNYPEGAKALVESGSSCSYWSLWCEFCTQYTYDNWDWKPELKEAEKE